jgi:uncharacterized protein (TIGR03546 family)
MVFLKLLGKLIKALRSNASPKQIAGGFVLGMIIGLTPLASLHNLVVVLIIMLIRVNLSMVFFSFLLCSGIAYLIDPLFLDVGYWILTGIPFLQGVWTAWYNTPVIALTRFYNTLVMGSFVVSILLIFPMMPLVQKGVVLYREKIDARLQKWKIFQLLKSSKIYTIYNKISHFGE